MEEPQRQNNMNEWRLVDSTDVLGTEGNQCKAEYYPEELRKEVWFCQLQPDHKGKHALEPAWTVT